MTYQVKPLPALLASHKGTGSSPGCFMSNPGPANVSGQTAESGPSTWDPATHVENLGRIPGSTFSLVQPGQEN